MELFLEDDSDVLLTDDQGHTSLHLAAQWGRQLVHVKLLSDNTFAF